MKNLLKFLIEIYNTKSTRRGTGLGLSMLYDIVKAYGGELKVISSEGDSSEFIIRLSFATY